MATLKRQLERALTERDEAIEFAASVQDLDGKYFEQRHELALAMDHIRRLKGEVSYERLQRVSAQRGLVSYLRETGQAERIGYDPDGDPVVQEDITKGKIPPPRNDPRFVREAALATVAAMPERRAELGAVSSPAPPTNPTPAPTVA